MKPKYWGGLIAVVVIIGSVLIYRYLEMRNPSSGSEVSQTAPTTAPLIETAHPSVHIFVLRMPWIGTVEAQASVELTALVAGRVETIEIGDQMPVRAGEVIARLGGPQVQAQRGQFQARMDSLQSQLDIAGQRVERLQRDLDEHLITKDQLSAAEQEQIQVQSQLRDVRLSYETFEKQIELRAPIDGTFTNRRVSVGQTVNIGDTIGEIVDTGNLRVEARVFAPEEITLNNAKAFVIIEEDRSVPGTVQYILPEAGSEGETIIWIEGPEINKQLRPGQTVSGNVNVEMDRPSLALPQSAIVYDSQEQAFVFVRKDATYERRSVRLGLAENGLVEVLSGVNSDDSVVTLGAYELFYREFGRQFKVKD